MLLSGSGGQDARSRPGRPAWSRSQRHHAERGARTPGERWDCPPASQVLQPKQLTGKRWDCPSKQRVCNLRVQELSPVNAGLSTDTASTAMLVLATGYVPARYYGSTKVTKLLKNHR